VNGPRKTADEQHARTAVKHLFAGRANGAVAVFFWRFQGRISVQNVDIFNSFESNKSFGCILITRSARIISLWIAVHSYSLITIHCP
jgi:hypothetical protein